MVAHLLDLPDALLTQILAALPTPASLLQAMSASRALAAAASDECWQAYSNGVAWRVRRQHSGDGSIETHADHFRRAHTAASTMLLIGGDRGGTADEPEEMAVPLVEAFDYASEVWLASPSVPPLSVASWRNAPCAACDRGIAYVVGGWEDDEEEALADVLTFYVPRHKRRRSSSSVAGSTLAWPRTQHRYRLDASPRTYQPLKLPDLPEARCFAAATFDAAGHLWVVGGGNGMTRGAECLTSIVTIDPNAEVPIWQPFGGAPLLAPRCGLSLAADGNHHALYLCGGYSGGVTYQDTVEVLDMAGVEPGRLLPPMRHARSGCGAGIGPDGALYIVGGSDDGSNMLSSCERYDPREGCWHALPDLPTARGYLAAAFSPDGALYAGGGCADGWGSPVDAFEAFDTRAGKWKILPPLPQSRSNHAIVLASTQ